MLVSIGPLALASVAARKDLAVHGLESEIKHGGNINSYDDDPHDATGRFPFGLPRTDNATATCGIAKTQLTKPDRRSFGETELHYLWIQLFHSALNEKGRAGFVMANGTREAHSCPMKISKYVRKYAAEQGIAVEEALKNGMEEKSKEFVEKGAEVYVK